MPQTVGDQGQFGRRTGDVAGDDVDFVPAGQEPLDVLEGPLLRAAASGVEVIDNQPDFHGKTPCLGTRSKMRDFSSGTTHAQGQFPGFYHIRGGRSRTRTI